MSASQGSLERIGFIDNRGSEAPEIGYPSKDEKSRNVSRQQIPSWSGCRLSTIVDKLGQGQEVEVLLTSIFDTENIKVIVLIGDTNCNDQGHQIHRWQHGESERSQQKSIEDTIFLKHMLYRLSIYTFNRAPTFTHLLCDSPVLQSAVHHLLTLQSLSNS